MGKYALRRLWQMVPVLFIISIAVFSIIHFIPGSPVEIIAGPNATDEQLTALRSRMGLDRPVWVQYLLWLRRVAAGDLGQSYINNYPVNDLIARRVPATVELALAAALVSVAISLPLGIVAALRPGSPVDFVATAFSALSFAVPGFLLLILLILFFSLRLQLLPPSGRPSLIEQPAAHLQSLILPAVTLGVGVAARLVRYLRSSLLEVLDQDYIRTARAKGLGARLVLIRHALRNALIPVVTIFGLQFGDLLSGAIIVESIYAWPGVGQLVVQAIGWRDYSLLQAVVLYIVVAFLLINLVTDLTYGFLDPRIRYDR